jgi:hypothetical protein
MTIPSASIALSVNALEQNTNDMGTPSFTLARQFLQAYTNGAGANQIDRLFCDNRTINAASNDDLDLAGALLEPLGSAFVLVRLKLLVVQNPVTNDGNVEVGGAGAAQFSTMFGAVTEKVLIKPGGLLLLYAPDATGYVVTATTADILRIRNGGTATRDIPVIIGGCST